jgi:hypothetical protein
MNLTSDSKDQARMALAVRPGCLLALTLDERGAKFHLRLMSQYPR